MKIFDIWSEGYVATGDSGKATYHGEGTGKTFKAACIKKFKDDNNYCSKNNTYWACCLFDNEDDARESFG